VTLNLSEEEWKSRLTPEQYRALREKGTEAPFTGKLLANKAGGNYMCAACGAELFKSGQKFDSGSGWPSFYDVATKGAVKIQDDNYLGMKQLEVICSNCGSHLGHLYDDAPDQPTGMRYCINSNALDFKKEPKT
jgi:peptide-methionine (R)-S-oxide reductase